MLPVLTLIALPVALVAVLLSTAALALFARPRSLFGPLAWLDDRIGAWHEGRFGDADEERLLSLAARLRWPVLALVFGWSFVAGAMLALSGLR